MSLNGNLKEFPIPEVMLFIGKRIGRLRLFDIPNSAEVEIDFADGFAHALYLAGSILTDPNEMITILSVIVEAGSGQFEFEDRPVQKRQHDQQFEINHLVMSLVVHIDLKLAERHAQHSPDDVYMAVNPPPDITIDRALKFFYDQSQELLKGGVQPGQLAEVLGLELDVVVLHLIYLRQLGLVKILGIDDTNNLPVVGVKKALIRKTSGYELAAEASELLMRTGKLIMKSGKLWTVPPRVASAKKTGED